MVDELSMAWYVMRWTMGLNPTTGGATGLLGSAFGMGKLKFLTKSVMSSLWEQLPPPTKTS